MSRGAIQKVEVLLIESLRLPCPACEHPRGNSSPHVATFAIRLETLRGRRAALACERSLADETLKIAREEVLAHMSR